MLGQRPLQFADHQRTHIGQRRARRGLDRDFHARDGVDGRNALNVAEARDLDENFALGGAHAGALTGHLAHTAVSEAIKSSINASSWNGDGVKRKRSAPRGTVG